MSIFHNFPFVASFINFYLRFRKFGNGEFPLGTHKMPTVQDVVNKFEKFDPEMKAKELMEYEEELTKNTVYMPARVKRKLEWKQKRSEINGESNGVDNGNAWIEEENDENEMPKKKKKQKKSVKVAENEESDEVPSKVMKKMKKLRVSLPNTTKADEKDTNAEENAKKLIKEWMKKGKEVESSPKTKKSSKVMQKHEKEDTHEASTPKSKSLVLNPFAAASSSTSKKKPQTPKNKLKGKGLLLSQQTTPTKQTNNDFDSSEKRVKIALNMNMVQEKHEYIEAVKNSPVPYDSSKKPAKGLLKPNLLPSPINPFYKKRIGLKFNDTL